MRKDDMMKLKMNLCLLFVIIFGTADLAFLQTNYKDLKYPKLGKVELPESETIKLDNGMTVVLVEDHEFPFIKMRAEYTAGEVWGVPKDQTGLARMTGQVMRSGGSVSMTGDEIDEKLESIAASVETWISDVYGGASANTLKDNFDAVADIFAGVLRSPAFPEEKIELAKIQAKSAISRRNDDAGEIANREFNRIIYKNSRLSLIEEYETIDAVCRDDLVDFHKKWVRPNGMVLGVWGDFNKNDMISKIKSLFQDWEPAGSPEIKKPDIQYDWSASLNLVEKNDVNQSTILIGHLGGVKDSPDYAALIMMNEILGGGFSSRMFKRIRSDSGFAYSTGARYGTHFTYPGVFKMTCRTKSERTVAAIKAMIKEMRLMTRELVTDEELLTAKEGWLNSYVFNFDSVDEIVRRQIQYAYYGYPSDFLRKTRVEIEKVTRDDILRVAKKHLLPDKVHILVVGKPAEFDQPLSVLGKVNEIDITIPEPQKQAPQATEDDLLKGKQLFLAMLERMGGAEKLAAVKNATFDFEMVQLTPMGEMTMQAHRVVVYPDNFYMKMDTPQGVVQIISNSSETWLQVPQGELPAPEYVVKQMKSSKNTDLSVLCNDLDRVKVQYAGENQFGDRSAHELIVTFNDYTFSFFIDDNFNPLGKKFNNHTPQGPVTAEEFWYDVKEKEGLFAVHRIETYVKGELASTINIHQLEYNTEVDMTVFDK